MADQINYSRKPTTLRERVEQKKLDWRFPDESSFSDLNLDCRQTCIKEVLSWLGEKDLAQVFLDHFSCHYTTLTLRTNEPSLHRGWELVQQQVKDLDSCISSIQTIFREKGYVLFYYRAFDFKYSAYYQKYDLIHWALVVDADEQGITIMDDSGTPEYYKNYLGCFTWAEFVQGFIEWPIDAKAGVGFLKRRDSVLKWEEEFTQICNLSVKSMFAEHGISAFQQFIYDLATLPLDEITDDLERLEFDMHYYRRRRELWKIAIEQNLLPSHFVQDHVKQSIIALCKSWSLVMGVIMKWKYQPYRDYREKIVNYLNHTLQCEIDFLQYLERVK